LIEAVTLVIAVDGVAPGVGKSTLAEELVRAVGDPVVDLDTLCSFLRRRRDLTLRLLGNYCWHLVILPDAMNRSSHDLAQEVVSALGSTIRDT
jgi:hypothetical protein